jgi:hypothetical protein
MKLAAVEFSYIRNEDWSPWCNTACQFGHNYLRMQHFIDDTSEQIIVNLQNDSDTNSCSSSEE